MKKSSFKVVKIEKNKSLFNYEKKVLIKELILDLKLGYYDFEKEIPQKVKFSLEIDYEDKKPSNDKDLKSIVNYAKIVKLIKKLVKNKHYNFLETLAEDVFDELFKDRRIDKISLRIEKLEILKDCSSVGIQISKKEVMVNSDIGKEVIKKEIPLVPKLPGVYRMLNAKNEVLYVGKAKNLPNRLKSYVSEKNHIIRTERMLSQTVKLEITTTSNESEALLLEANLIKKFKPRFNILLRDDKSFPFIFIGNKDKWPQIKRHRGKKNREGFFFGPFASAGSANWTIKMIQKIFQLRVCDDTVFKNRERPCILYQIKRCSGPCVGYVKEDDYKKSVEDAIEFVSGKSRKIQKNLSLEMEKSSEDLDFEKAAILRDRIKSLNIIQSSQRINEANLVEADVIAGYKESGKTCVQVFFYRSKQNWGNQAFFPKHDPDENLNEILNSFVSQFYENKSVPSSIIISEEIKEKDLIEKALTKKEGKQINISVAKKGSKLNVINQAIKNAKDSLNRKIYESQNNKELFDEVATKFDLENNINLIEVYDNSHIQGSNSVGALITYGEEGFIKKRYRKFNIKIEKNEQDDYGMMREVLNRRFKRAVQEKDNYLTMPDLVIIDGGKGQYSVARETMNELGLHDIPIIAIAKGKFRNSGNETFFHNGKDFKFEKNNPTLFFFKE